MNLYEIGAEYQKALTLSVESPDDAQALICLLDEVEGLFEAKAANVVAYARNLEAESGAYKAEAKRLAERAAAFQAKADMLKRYIENQMRACGMIELKAGFFDLKFVKNPWAVEIEEGAEIPEEYIRVKREPDKTKLAEALKAGWQIEGVRLTQTERLRIE